ncbi:MAG TPA: L-threonylcarbamoyladenylate synthase, partial [Acidimicrobiales bacterium]|nr:L-threonylcarbamoyladenylate synthase [Acidimicrobiales bacterium]
GLGALAGEETATATLFAMKRRRPSVSLPVLVDSAETARGLIGVDDDAFWRLAERFWPGPLTIVTTRGPGVDLALGGEVSTVGLRCPDHPLARSLLARTGPLAVTSANRSGEPPATSAEEVTRTFGPSLVVLDGGTCDEAPSSVVSLLHDKVRILREGPIGEEAIRAVLGR